MNNKSQKQKQFGVNWFVNKLYWDYNTGFKLNNDWIIYGYTFIGRDLDH